MKEIINYEKLSAGSIPRVARILNCLSEGTRSVTAIAQKCKYAKSTVHRVLKIMEQSRLVVRDPLDNSFYIGPLITKLSINPQIAHEFLVRCSMEEIKKLASITTETVCIDILQGTQIIPIYEVKSTHEIQIISTQKKIRSVFIGASGRVLLSQMPNYKLKVAIKYASLNKITDTTVTDKGVLLSQVLETRRKGYAISFGEWIPNSVCMSVPILNYIVPVALSIVGPEFRMKPDIEIYLVKLIESAQFISRNLQEIYHGFI